MVSFFVPYRVIGPLTPLNSPKPDSNENVRMAKEQEDLVKQLLSYLYRTKEYWRLFFPPLPGIWLGLHLLVPKPYLLCIFRV